MEYIFSDRISSLKASAIREILKVTQDPTVISFAAGSPDPKSFPAQEMKRIANEIFEKQSSAALQYGMTEGYTPLRELTRERLTKKYNIGKDTDELIITTGGQQVLDLAAKVFLNEGDVVICEDPSFVGGLNSFRSYNAKLVSCPMDENGMMMDKLEEILKNTDKVKLIYTIPTFQNPSGKTMKVERRQKMLELAEKYDVLIIEDNPYFELRYSGEYIDAIKRFDDNGRVIYAGSYSKILSPGIRLGFALAHKDIIAKLVVGKQSSDVHSNLFFQIIVAEYLKSNDIDKHIAEIKALYHRKRDIMLEELEKNVDKRVKFTKPDGGLFIWGELPEGFDGMALAKIAGAKKVAIVPGSTFSVDESKINNCFRMNFSLPSEEKIREGVKLLAESIDEYLGA